MSGLTLLIIGLASLAFVLAACAYPGVKGWRLAKKGAAVSREVAPLAAQLSRRSGDATILAERLAANGEQITASLERLQATARRLQVIADLLADAAAPYQRIRAFFGR